jgi:hypothetical protein
VIGPLDRIVIGGGDDVIVIVDHPGDPDGEPSGEGGDKHCVDDENKIDVGLVADYQRVDGLVFGLEQDFTPGGPDGVELHLSEAYAFHRERMLYEAAIERPLLPEGNLVLGGGLFRLTQPFDGLDERIVGDGENALAALLVKEDYRDYYEEEGGEIFLRQPIGEANSIRARYVHTTHLPVTNSTNTSLTRWGDDFRSNPLAHVGDLRAFRLALSRDSRPRESGHPGTAQWYRIEWERADGGLGGDFE